MHDDVSLERCCYIGTPWVTTVKCIVKFDIDCRCYAPPSLSHSSVVAMAEVVVVVQDWVLNRLFYVVAQCHGMSYCYVINNNNNIIL